jgi:glucosamine--fructose-6-phosphate aminotransferase (isomerizing)
MFATIARGSSDHAAYFLKYAFEIGLGLPCTSLGPSLASIYGVVPHVGRATVIAISQSGQSPDIIAMTEAARKGGALTVALVNTIPSPLADSCAHALDIAAGPEKSVAATKSFVCSVIAGLMLLAEIRPELRLGGALQRFPEILKDALDCEWADLAENFENSRSVYVIGRGPSLAIAHEVALKFKETCAMHAEAYSAAEIMHGPIELAGSGFPVLALAARDRAETNVAAIADELARKGASVHATSPLCQTAPVLPVPDAGHPLLNALVQIVPCYAFLEALSRRRGRDPDHPARLSKITETI